MFHRLSFPILLLAFTWATMSSTVSGKSTTCLNADEPENFLAGTSWKVNGIPFADRDRSEYLLSAYDPFSYEGQMGNFISFDEQTFSTDYNAPCGMDCFTSVTGEYAFTSTLRVRIRVEKIERHGFCDKGSEILDRNLGDFDLVKLETGWKLIKAQ